MNTESFDMEFRNSYYSEPVISHSCQQFFGSNLFDVDSSLTKQIAGIQISKSESFMDLNEETYHEYQECEAYGTATDFTKPLLIITDFQCDYMTDYLKDLTESAKGVYEFEPDLDSTDVGMKRIQSDYSIADEANFNEPLLVPLFYEQLNKAGRKQFLNFVKFQKYFFDKNIF